MKSRHLELGESGENLAEKYLRGKGMRIVDRRVRLRRGELDLIARDGAEWVFIEVKTRSTDRMGGATAAFTPAKASRMKRAVEEYVHRHAFLEQPICCDVVAIDFLPDGMPDIKHFPGCVIWE